MNLKEPWNWDEKNCHPTRMMTKMLFIENWAAFSKEKDIPMTAYQR